MTIFTFGGSSSRQGGTLVIFPKTVMIDSHGNRDRFFPTVVSRGGKNSLYFSVFSSCLSLFLSSGDEGESSRHGFRLRGKKRGERKGVDGGNDGAPLNVVSGVVTRVCVHSSVIIREITCCTRSLHTRL